MSSFELAGAGWRAVRLMILGIAAIAASGCNIGSRIMNIGDQPHLSPIQNPIDSPNYQPVRMPMPAPQIAERHSNSLWQSGSRAFFRDQRANDIGDILTVAISIDDSASINNSTTSSRNSAEDAELPSLLGFEGRLDEILPNEVNPSSLIDFGSTSSNTGSGQITRGEEIELRVAAIITQVLPNGNLAIYGRQEVRVNYEARDLEIAGVIRPEDISSENQIRYDQIAEARVSYGGRGLISDVQQPRYGQQLYDIIFPF